MFYKTDSKPNIEAFAINEPGEYGIFWGDEVTNYPQEKEPIIENFLYENDCICISSAPKCGKSLLATQLMMSLTSASRFLGLLECKRRCNVLYVQTEGDRSETIHRFERMRTGVDVDINRIYHMNLNGITLNTPDGFATFSTLADKPSVQYDVIIIDPLYTTVKGSLKSDDVATDWIRNVRKYRGKHGAAVIVLNHEIKDVYDYKGNKIERGNNQTFGSQMWLSFFNHNFVFKKYSGIHHLEIGVQRSGKIINNLEMKLIEEPLMFTTEEKAVQSRDSKLIDIFKVSGAPLNVRELIEISEMSSATVYRGVADLLQNNMIEKFETNPTTYKWKI